MFSNSHKGIYKPYINRLYIDDWNITNTGTRILNLDTNLYNLFMISFEM